MGDALKVGFKLMKQAHNLVRVLEAMASALRSAASLRSTRVDCVDVSLVVRDTLTPPAAAVLRGSSWSIILACIGFSYAKATSIILQIE